MADTVATISSSDEFFVTTSQQDLTTTSTDLAPPAVVESLDNVADVDTSTYGKLDGSVLVFRTTTNKWTSTRTLDAQNMEGGEF